MVKSPVITRRRVAYRQKTDDNSNEEQAVEEKVGKKKYICSKCGRGYSRKYILAKHIERCKE